MDTAKGKKGRSLIVSFFQVEKLGSPLNTLSNHLAQILKYEKGERDMLLLRHEVSVKGLSHGHTVC